MIPLATVSGVATTNAEMLDWFARNTPVTVLTTKSIQVEPNPGNREPVIAEPEPGSFVNAVGLRNPGLEATLEELAAIAPRRAEWPQRCRLNISLAGGSVEEFVLLARKLAPFADLLELNFSCPHAKGGYGAAIGCDRELVETYTRAVVGAVAAAAAVGAATQATASTTAPTEVTHTISSRGAGGAIPVYVKLPPDARDVGAISRTAVAAGATGITAINTVGPEVYRERHSGAPILTNPPDGRGGKSGRWIRQRALQCVADIRAAVGPRVPIIGMGGVETHAHAVAMVDAGASVVGVGSALALHHQRDWPRQLRSIAEGSAPAPTITHKSQAADTPRMNFTPFTVTDRVDLDDTLFEISLDGELAYGPGQVVFLWIPGVGEKPFSPAGDRPLQFLVQRRGQFSRALGELEAGATLYVRGPYGDSHDVHHVHHRNHGHEGGGDKPSAGTALLIAAGSGAAVLPALVRALGGLQLPVDIYIGLSKSTSDAPLRRTFDRILTPQDTLSVVYDQGQKARVLSTVNPSPRTDRAYVIGPEAFMRSAKDRLSGPGGIPTDRMWFSLEQRMLCGVGLCGACHVRGILTCMYGTFVRGDRLC